jgi:hypothetical protein
VRQRELKSAKVLFALQPEDLAHLHSGSPLDLLIEVEK